MALQLTSPVAQLISGQGAAAGGLSSVLPIESGQAPTQASGAASTQQILQNVIMQMQETLASPTTAPEEKKGFLREWLGNPITRTGLAILAGNHGRSSRAAFSNAMKSALDVQSSITAEEQRQQALDSQLENARLTRLNALGNLAATAGALSINERKQNVDEINLVQQTAAKNTLLSVGDSIDFQPGQKEAFNALILNNDLKAAADMIDDVADTSDRYESFARDAAGNITAFDKVNKNVVVFGPNGQRGTAPVVKITSKVRDSQGNERDVTMFGTFDQDQFRPLGQDIGPNSRLVRDATPAQGGGQQPAQGAQVAQGDPSLVRVGTGAAGSQVDPTQGVTGGQGGVNVSVDGGVITSQVNNDRSLSAGEIETSSQLGAGQQLLNVISQDVFGTSLDRLAAGEDKGGVDVFDESGRILKIMAQSASGDGVMGMLNSLANMAIRNTVKEDLSPAEARVLSSLEGASNIVLAAMRGAQVGPAEQERFNRMLSVAGQSKEAFRANLLNMNALLGYLEDRKRHLKASGYDAGRDGDDVQAFLDRTGFKPQGGFDPNRGGLGAPNFQPVVGPNGMLQTGPRGFDDGFEFEI